MSWLLAGIVALVAARATRGEANRGYLAVLVGVVGVLPALGGWTILDPWLWSAGLGLIVAGSVSSLLASRA